jgi:IclR family acetate operon transcriptional repressor
MSETSRYHVTGVDRTVAILACFEATARLRLTDVARETGLSEATALRYLTTLGRHGFVERDAAGAYALGIRVFKLGRRALGRPDVRKLALPHLERLLQRFGETVNLAVRQGEEVVIIDVLESSQSIRKGASIGESDSWHCSGLGKAILATLPPAEARALLARLGLPRATGRTLTTVEALEADLQAIRARGYAVDDEEAEDGLRCVAAAVRDHHGRARYAISVSGPANRLTLELVPALGPEVARAADGVSRGLGFDDAVRRDGMTHEEESEREVRIDQVFPRCARCGKMLHEQAARIELPTGGRRPLPLCSSVCEEEYLELHGIAERGTWVRPVANGASR